MVVLLLLQAHWEGFDGQATRGHELIRSPWDCKWAIGYVFDVHRGEGFNILDVVGGAAILSLEDFVDADVAVLYSALLGNH